MGWMRVISPGFLTTVQDLGRPGWTHVGVSPSGAADTVALRLGNQLVGNPPNSSALEMTLLGGTFEFESSTVIALAGSDFEPMLDGMPLPMWQSRRVLRGQVLRCGMTKEGARCYLCVHGGFIIEPFLGSASTHLTTSLGGMKGRRLFAGDRLQLRGLDIGDVKQRRVDTTTVEYLYDKKNNVLRVTAGPQYDLFTDQAVDLFTNSTYVVSEDSNRMGLRLSGPPIKRHDTHDIVTEGVSLGAVQVPPHGEPIILFVEHQTTGGYPKLANVISAEMHRVGQLRPRDEVRFRFVGMDEALSLLSDLNDRLIKVGQTV
jgi:biotin-dependent carboxylase-like uncharacterized protein